MLRIDRWSPLALVLVAGLAACVVGEPEETPPTEPTSAEAWFLDNDDSDNVGAVAFCYEQLF